MTIDGELFVEAVNPHLLAEFWADALGYQLEDHSAFIRRLIGASQVDPGDLSIRDGHLCWYHSAAIRHPRDPVDQETGSGRGRRIVFLSAFDEQAMAVPFVIDLPVIADRFEQAVERLQSLGASLLFRDTVVLSESAQPEATLADPEGNQIRLIATR